jgi:predicted NBD/HSP70 family sugar kinase
LSGETGIGASAVLGGEILGGRHGWAGEIGHACVEPGGPSCACGSRGCLELYAGRKAIIKAAGLDEETPTKRMVELLDEGEPAVQEAVQSACSALGTALVGAVNMLDINVVVLGGHLGEIGRFLQVGLEEELGRRVLSARWMPPRVEWRSPDDALAARGAAYVPLRRVLADPAAWIARRHAL